MAMVGGVTHGCVRITLPEARAEAADYKSFSPGMGAADGSTALSASALVITGDVEVMRICRNVGGEIAGWGPDQRATGASVVVTLASLVKPFTTPRGPLSPGGGGGGGGAARFSVRSLESGVGLESTMDGETWVPNAPGIALFTVPTAQAVLASVLRAGEWAAGQGTATAGSTGGQSQRDTDRHRLELVAILVPTAPHRQHGHAGCPVAFSPPPWRWGLECGCCRPVGTPTTVVGSPYGVFEPHVFFGTLSTGVFANKIPPVSAASSGTARGALAARALACDGSCSGGPGLVLISAPCHPGMAGAPVIAGDPKTGTVAGMVLAPLVRKDGLVMELSFMLPWCHISAALLGPQQATIKHSVTREDTSAGLQASQTQPPARSGTPASLDTGGGSPTPVPGPNALLSVPSPRSGLVRQATRATVLIQSSDHWGTGVIIDVANGFVLTNAHLVRSGGKAVNGVQTRVLVGDAATGNDQAQWLGADVVFIADPFPDIALLKIRSRSPGSMRDKLHDIRCCDAATLFDADGEDVMVLGYPSLPPSCTTSPTITFGKMAIRRSNRAALPAGAAAAVAAGRASGPALDLEDAAVTRTPVVSLILTTATVHPGSSGGPVVRVSDGSLVGILTSFSQCCDEYGELVSAHPRLNFAIPVTLLGPIFSFVESASPRTASVPHGYSTQSQHTVTALSGLQHRLDEENTKDITRFWIADESQARANLPKTLVSAKL